MVKLIADGRSPSAVPARVVRVGALRRATPTSSTAACPAPLLEFSPTRRRNMGTHERARMSELEELAQLDAEQ
jgi:hypothetical protein